MIRRHLGMAGVEVSSGNMWVVSPPLLRLECISSEGQVQDHPDSDNLDHLRDPPKWPMPSTRCPVGSSIAGPMGA
eukprot:6240136-Prorocentrum_lima.AAC.1